MSQYFIRVGIRLAFAGAGFLAIYIILQSAIPFLFWAGTGTIAFGLILFSLGMVIRTAEG